MQNLRILIVGAGVAGLTCAGLLKKQGIRPVLIEKDTPKNFNASGYMLGLLPLGGRVLTELNLERDYFEKSLEMETYKIHQQNGRLNKAYSLDFINQYYGSYRGIGRKELIDILLGQIDAAQIRYGVTATALNQGENAVDVTFSDGKKETFDLVIACDGMHSQTRKQLWTPEESSFYNTKWGGWVAWLTDREMRSYNEYWGASSFLGLYPVKNKIGVFLGGPNKLTRKCGLRNFIEIVEKHILPEYKLLYEALAVLSATETPYYWEFHDCRTADWVRGNVVLLGDAACGFLPTAGVGASVAMDSASALVDELSRTDRKHIAYGLKLYVNRQKERAETAQKVSRDLAKIMFVESPILAGIRDYALRFYSAEQLAKTIGKTLQGR